MDLLPLWMPALGLSQVAVGAFLTAVAYSTGRRRAGWGERAWWLPAASTVAAMAGHCAALALWASWARAVCSTSRSRSDRPSGSSGAAARPGPAREQRPRDPRGQEWLGTVVQGNLFLLVERRSRRER
jgi:hypothetical protein